MNDHADSPRAWLWEHFECKKCGRCCKEIGLPWDVMRLRKMAEILDIIQEDLIERYYGIIVMENGKKMIHWDDAKRTPCPFLLPDNTCRIYNVRPDGCRVYPIETDCGRQGVDCPGLTIPE